MIKGSEKIKMLITYVFLGHFSLWASFWILPHILLQLNILIQLYFKYITVGRSLPVSCYYKFHLPGFVVNVIHGFLVLLSDYFLFTWGFRITQKLSFHCILRLLQILEVVEFKKYFEGTADRICWWFESKRCKGEKGIKHDFSFLKTWVREWSCHL